MTTPPVGRRERKKAATRQAIADAALRLFLERGYDQVSIRDIADAADVSTTTVFKHFTGKEALVFDQDEDREAALIAAVRQRAAGQSIPDALRQHVLDSWLPIAAHPQMAEFTHLVETTPALRAYAERMWTRHTDALGAAIADEIGVDHDDLACGVLARFVLEIPALARGRQDRRAAVEAIFDILAHGWEPPGEPPAPRTGRGGAQGRSDGSPR
ncbi:TetR/AcrR family transcriptional regulator [Streptomyces sp. NPDC044780]|uniref:TetR/AcrR family transcriptional regulator n=1 Tax=Streptomyces luomodiensis TaxID=3026192 RepID=A0ABY9V9V1_9ACTN|nr:TetR/AcrR family transcriptional regulator [Streptomyces sp. SCA4-21]WNF00771.1 TetR/AcrR family transcriptional regulator [Streptomyces sp. SCA4-21]